MAWLLWQLLQNPGFLKSHFTFWGVVAAAVIGTVGNLVVGVTFSDMVAKSAPSIDFRRRISAYYYSQIAKYIPGQVASLLIQRSVLSGARATTATLMSNLELMMLSCWLCSGAAIALLVYMASATGALLVVVATVAFGAWLIRMNWQPWVCELIRLIPRYRYLSTTSMEIAKTPRLRAISLSIGIMLLPALSSYILLAKGMHIDYAMAIPLTASLMLAWVIGVLVFIFPAGIGIRELVFFGVGNVLVSSPGGQLMAEVAVASRLLHIIVDIVGVAAFLVVTQIYSRVTNQGQ